MTFRNCRFAVAPLTLMIAVMPAAWAEEVPDKATVLEQVEVTAPAERSGPAVIKGDALVGKRAANSDAASLLGGIPGVSLQGAGGVSSLPSIHGMADDRVHVEVDGMNLVASCPNHMNPPLSYIDPTKVASVKVFAGITPVSVGGDSIGGTIQVESAPPEFAEAGQKALFKGQAGAYYRSNGNANGINLGMSLAGEQASVTYDGAMAEAGNYKAAKDFKAAGQAAWGRGWLGGDEVGSSRYKTENHALGFAFRQDNHLFELKVGVQHAPYEGFPNQRMDMLGNDSTQINLRYKGRYQWGALEARVYDEKTRHKMDFGDDRLYWYTTVTHNIPGMPMDTEGKTTGALVKADVVLNERDILRVGGEYQRYRLNDWWSPSGGGMAPNTFLNINNGERDRLDVFAEWEARWSPQWLSQVGIRAATVDMNTDNVQGYYNADSSMGMTTNYLTESTAFNARDHRRTDHNLDLTALARYTPEATRTIEAGYAQKTRSPNLYERYTWSTGGMAMLMNNFAGDGNGYVGNLDLKPEVAHTLSLTGDWHDAAPEGWGLKATPYLTYVDDYIDVRRCSSANANCGAANQLPGKTTGYVYLQYVNQSARLYGLDLSGRLPLGRAGGWGDFSLSGLLNFTRGTNRTTGDNLYNIMPLNLKLAVVQRLSGWTNTAELQLVDAKTHVSQVRDEVKTGGYALVNLRSSYGWKRARLDVGIENLFNRFYNLPLGGAYVGQGTTMSATAPGNPPWGVPVPGPGRSLYAAVNVNF